MYPCTMINNNVKTKHRPRKAYKILMAIVMTTIICSCEQTHPPRDYSLRVPFDVSDIRKNIKTPYTKKFKCRIPPEPMKDLFFETMYDKSSKNASVVNPDALKTYKEKTKPLKTFESRLTSTANMYVKSDPPRAEIAACVISWMSIWADARAMLGKDNKSGEFLRKWLLSSISLAYIQVRNDPYIAPAEHQKVQEWIRAVSQRVVGDFTKHPHIGSRNNNHMYWAAWGVMAAGIALDDQEMFDWALYEAKVGIHTIQDNGTLPLEISRGRKAYHYHVFAAVPLFMMAETARVNDIDLYSVNKEGLKRLANLILENTDDQADFVKLTGEEQDLTRTLTSSSLVWLEIYLKYYKNEMADLLLERFRPFKHSRVGGDATLLYGQ